MSLTWEQAHCISIVEYLTRYGIFPVYSHLNGQEYHYHSPIRSDDSTPSFHVNVIKNKWHDKGSGLGGDIIELVVHHQKLTRSQSCHWLSKAGLYRGGYVPERVPVQRGKYYSTKSKKGGVSGAKPINTNSQYAVLESDTSFMIDNIQELQHPILLKYLQHRKINPDIAKVHGLKEINYQLFGVPDSHYFALAWLNDSGGCEYNRKGFKGCLGVKDVTSINLQPGKKLAVFESAIDFWSYLTHYDIAEFDSSAVILNSVSLKARVIEIAEQYSREEIYLFLDNDDEGRGATEWISEQISDIPVKDKSGMYAEVKDFNEMMTA